MKKKKINHFAPIFSSVLYSEKWKELTRSERELYIYLKVGDNGSNNGEITLPYSNLKGIMNSATMSKALRGLIYKDWIVKAHSGGLYEKASKYKITYLHDKRLGKK